MPENTEPPDRGTITNIHHDVVLNDETRRALREWRRRLYAGGAVVAGYVAVRTYGFSHHEAVCAASQAVREAAAATTTLGAHQRAEHPPEAIDTDATPPFADADIVTDTVTDTDTSET